MQRIIIIKEEKNTQEMRDTTIKTNPFIYRHREGKASRVNKMDLIFNDSRIPKLGKDTPIHIQKTHRTPIEKTRKTNPYSISLIER